MKIIVRVLAVLLALVALAAASLSVYIVARWHGRPVELVDIPAEAQRNVQALFQAVEQGDYAAAEALIFGQPALGVTCESEDMLSAMVWDAYQKSLKFEPVGAFYATDTGLAIAYKVTRLDFAGIMDRLPERVAQLMQERIDKAEYMEELYDSDHEFRSEIVRACVEKAVGDALQEDASYIQTEFTVELIFQDGVWWIVGNEGLIDALSASFAD